MRFNGQKNFVLLSVTYNLELHRAPQRWRAPLESECREGEPVGKTPSELLVHFNVFTIFL